ncbi:hypothetical protein SAMN07250955_10644 [Arboricoccus pini]|uniref:Uncharacterized protein n=1 Tax=Arboricoccus pini TaxID=1963835 RepID=A0A212R6H9_9PROT|nr:hypothetical protein [Arboricoccus pini]SNB67767.1 hypothetical protein SAMN07250955_10644 [Arboricoccus pini]
MLVEAICPIWDVPAERDPIVGNAVTYRSPRTDGAYTLIRAALPMLQNLDEAAKARLTSWVVEQHRAGDESPRITSDTLSLIENKHSMPLNRRFDQLLLFFATRERILGYRLDLGNQHTNQFSDDGAAAAAWTECRTIQELANLCRLLMGRRLVQFNGGELSLTVNGYERLEVLQTQPTVSLQGFVAMWFDTTMDDVYQRGIAPAIEDCRYTPMRIDRKEHINKIDDEIIAEIRRSRFMIADFTCGTISDGERKEAIARGGVYYEAGFARGLNIPVFWTCRKDMIEHVHFDTRQYAHILWEDPDELRKKLKNCIEAVLGTRYISAP